MTLTLVASNQKLSTHINVTPNEVVFPLTEVFFPVHADSSFVGTSVTGAQKFTVTCVTIVTL